MRRRPERRGGLAGPAARGRGPARGCAARRSPGRWLGGPVQGCGAGCGLPEEMGAAGRLWAPASGYLISLPVPCALQRWVLRLPSLFVSSFCSFVSSLTGSAWVLCAIRISRLNFREVLGLQLPFSTACHSRETSRMLTHHTHPLPQHTQCTFHMQTNPLRGKG